MEEQRSIINHVLVVLFNDILRIEENAVCSGEYAGLTMREIHVLEAVHNARKENTMAVLAKILHITAGSLTVAVHTLEKKGYLKRVRSEIDRRMIHIIPTEAGRYAALRHIGFHKEMTEAVVAQLSTDEVTVLLKALTHINEYFLHKETS